MTPASLDESEARAKLERMLGRPHTDPRAVLAVAMNAAPADVRKAFLELTKQFHPSKFARYSPEVARLADEVFFLIKRAYESLDPAAARRAGGLDPRKTPPVGIPAMRSTGSTIPPPTAAPPRSRPPTPRAAPTSGTREIEAEAIGGAAEVAVSATPRPRRPSMASAASPAGSPPALSVPASIPELGALPDVGAAPDPWARALSLLDAADWSAAERQLAELAVSMPAEPRYRAYRHYARGQLAYGRGHWDDARREWERALAASPELEVVQRAIATLPATRGK